MSRPKPFSRRSSDCKKIPVNPLLLVNRASYLAAAGLAEDAAEGYREILELNPSMVLAIFICNSLAVRASVKREGSSRSREMANAVLKK